MNLKILSIDYGIKRTGLAITDQLQIIASGVTTVKTKKLLTFLSYYIFEEKIQKIVIGEQKKYKNQNSLIEKEIQLFISKFCILFPEIYIDRIDEQFTSKLAKKNIVGIKKINRINKSLLDKISATMILQSYIDKKKI